MFSLILAGVAYLRASNSDNGSSILPSASFLLSASDSVSTAKFQALENRVTSIEGKLAAVVGRLDAEVPDDEDKEIPFDSPAESIEEASATAHTTPVPRSALPKVASGESMASTASEVASARPVSRPVSSSVSAGEGSAGFKNAGVCVVGPGISPKWNLPPGKYKGAHGGHFGGDPKFREGTFRVPNRKACSSRFDSVKTGAVPLWINAAAASSAQYAEIEGRLQAHDTCVEEKRKASSLKSNRPCFRCHSVAQQPHIVQIHSELIRRLPHCRTICETGFNRGDSALILSTACGKDTIGLSFTINSRWYTAPGRQCLGEGVLEGNRSITYVEGFSTTSITDFLGRNAKHDFKCDVIHVDGGKSEEIRLQDLHDLRKVSHEGTLWITDDIYAVCKDGSCHAVRDKHNHCLYGVFGEFLKELDMPMKCSNSAGTDTAQCYGSAIWDTILKQ